MTVQEGHETGETKPREEKPLKPGKLIEQLRRRQKVFEYWSGRDLGPRDIKGLLLAEAKIKASTRTIERDLETMDTWLPLITKIQGDHEAATAELLGTLRLIRQRALNLGTTADNSSARVGALRAASEAAGREIDLRLKTGQIKPPPDRLEVTTKNEYPGINEAQISRYIGTIVAVALEQETRDTNPEDDPANPKQPVDPKPPTP